jgi:hypothetical protein
VVERFGAVFKDCIQQTNNSVAWFAREIGMNRGMLYNIWDGKRKLPEERLHQLLRAHVFTPVQEQRLRETYYRAVYGEEAFERLLFIKNALARMTQPEITPVLPKDPYRPQGAIEAISNVARMAKALRFMLETELAESSPHIDTNYPFSAVAIDDLVYTILKKNDQAVQFRHIISFEQDGQSVHNLQNLFASLRYCKLRHSPLYRYAAAAQNCMYPCFFITNRHALLFHPEGNNGLFISEPEVVATISLNVSQQMAACTPLALFLTNEMELQQIYAQKSLLKQDGGGFSWWPCLVGFMDFKLLDQVAAPDIPARNAVLQIIESFYRTLLNNASAPLFFTPQGFRAFAATGQFHEASERFLLQASPTLRAEILGRVSGLIETRKFNILLLDETEVAYPQNFCLDFYGNGLCARGTISEFSDGFSGEYTIFLDDAAMLQDFENFKDYIQRNRFYYPQEWTLQLLEELRAKCDGSVMAIAG